jgi:hypothetical protein
VELLFYVLAQAGQIRRSTHLSTALAFTAILGCSSGEPIAIHDDACDPCDSTNGPWSGCVVPGIAPPRGGWVFECRDGCRRTVEVCSQFERCSFAASACVPLPSPRPETAEVNEFCYGLGEYSCTSTTACGGTVIMCGNNWLWRDEQVCAPNERCARLSESSTVTECVAGCG